MITDSRFIIVAGTARNVGKTTLVCKIIAQNIPNNVVALKFISLKKGGLAYEHHQNISTYKIIEEKHLELEKDTVKMLKAGAKKSF